MPLRWKSFRIICILQLVIAVFILFNSAIRVVFDLSFTDIAECILFLLIMLLAIFAINLVNNNYPDTPVTGTQKKNFNRLFLANFIFLAFLFGFIIAEFKSLQDYADGINRSVSDLDFEFFTMLTAYLVTLIFQFVILYGLFVLRRLLYLNFTKQKFEFEK
jgi:hypothetical protein